jgi:hypothetical protein
MMRSRHRLVQLRKNADRENSHGNDERSHAPATLMQRVSSTVPGLDFTHADASAQSAGQGSGLSMMVSWACCSTQPPKDGPGRLFD